MVGGESIFHDSTSRRRLASRRPLSEDVSPLPSARLSLRCCSALAFLKARDDYDKNSASTSPKGASSSRCRSIDTSQMPLRPRCDPSPLKCTLKVYLAVHARRYRCVVTIDMGVSLVEHSGESKIMKKRASARRTDGSLCHDSDIRAR